MEHDSAKVVIACTENRTIQVNRAMLEVTLYHLTIIMPFILLRPPREEVLHGDEASTYRPFNKLEEVSPYWSSPVQSLAFTVTPA